MARTYLFFRPSRLPLEPDELEAGTVLALEDGAGLRASLEQAFPGLQWISPASASATVDGGWYELHLPSPQQTSPQTLSLRCSLRSDPAGHVQALCDRFGWLAFDEQPLCYQPRRPPFRA